MRKFGEFYSKYKDKLFAYLMRNTGDYHLSNDIMQESFKRYLEHYADEPHSGALLFTIARNTLLDSRRKSQRNNPYAEEDSYGNQNPEHYLMVRAEYRQVLSAMQSLDEVERAILALVVSSEFSYREIAAITGISESNVKVKVHRARVKLREIISAGSS